MIVPKPAAVRPRVTHSESDDPLPLDDEVRARLAGKQWGLVELVGLPGSGKSTAIAHLAHMFAGSDELVLADRPNAAELQQLIKSADRRLVVCASPGRLPKDLPQHWWLSSWTRDDLIEYLLATQRECCGRVLTRIDADADRELLGGVPELWTLVLDQLAANQQLSNVKSALQTAIRARLTMPELRSSAEDYCWRIVHDRKDLDDVAAELSLLSVNPGVWSLLRHAPVQVHLAAQHLAGQLSQKSELRVLEGRLPEKLVVETAAIVRDDEGVMARLESTLRGGDREQHAMAASLLHAAGRSLLPLERRAAQLSHAYLKGVQWPGARLVFADWCDADLSHAVLSGATLTKVLADRTRLIGARLDGAKLRQLMATSALLSGADLRGTRAIDGCFRAAAMQRADLTEAVLRSADFSEAILVGTCFRRADLACATFVHAAIEGADFTAANLAAADLSDLALRQADFTHARFSCAKMYRCDLEFMQLPEADFELARLDGSHLTGSYMPGACFRKANLSGTGLAEIEWEGADLRGADLSGCTFHMGSSRSGLVGSPLASEGSRTGFYTDEYHEQEFKAPEEIRKANLRGADLRGAEFRNVDFYLVDLRDAIYTAGQEEHFRRCRAILETRMV